MNRFPFIALVVFTACSKPAAPVVSTTPAPSPSAATPSLDVSFTPPAGWTQEPPTNKLRKAQYRVPDKEKSAADALLTVSHFRGGGMSVDANLQRWAQQMGAAEATPEPVEASLKTTLADLPGTYTPDDGETIQTARMLAAVVETADGPWYFKLVGPADTVGDWRDEFIAMLKCAKKTE